MRELCLPKMLDISEIEQLSEAVLTRTRVRRGEVLYRAGDPFDVFYAIRLGHLKSAVISPDGHEQITGFYMAGDIVGLDGLACSRYSCDLIALEDTETCVVSYSKLFELSTTLPSLMQHFNQLLSREIVRQNGLLLLLGSMRAEERLAAFLLNISQRFEERRYSKSEFVLRMTRAEIGSFLGLKLETVSRVLSHFMHERLIQVNQKRVQILNFEKLRAIVGGANTSNDKSADTNVASGLEEFLKATK